jgi:hypothetical protein
VKLLAKLFTYLFVYLLSCMFVIYLLIYLVFVYFVGFIPKFCITKDFGLHLTGGMMIQMFTVAMRMNVFIALLFL